VTPNAFAASVMVSQRSSATGGVDTITQNYHSDAARVNPKLDFKK